MSTTPTATPTPDPDVATWPLLRRGSREHAWVEYLQRRLLDAGHDPGPVDGRFGPRTERAVLTFQGSAGLVRDGIVGPRTWGALEGLHPAPTAPTASTAPRGSTGVAPAATTDPCVTTDGTGYGASLPADTGAADGTAPGYGAAPAEPAAFSEATPAPPYHRLWDGVQVRDGRLVWFVQNIGGPGDPADTSADHLTAYTGPHSGTVFGSVLILTRPHAAQGTSVQCESPPEFLADAPDGVYRVELAVDGLYDADHFHSMLVTVADGRILDTGG